MRKFIVKLCSLIIPVSKWRKAFRHYFIFEPDEAVLQNLRHTENAVSCAASDTGEKSACCFSIGIVTYNKRFETFFVPLIKQIRRKFDGDIIVCINGNHNEEFDAEYRKNILAFLSGYPRVYPMMFTDFRSLAKLWNNCLINSKTDHMLLLNDDVVIHDDFWPALDAAIVQKQEKSFKINGVWSHVFLDRREVADLGWFDERLLGIGYEDTDFEARWLLKYKAFMPQVIDVAGLDNVSDDKETVLNQKKVWGKYSLFNKEFFFEKFKVKNSKRAPYEQKLPDAPQYPYENFYWRRNNEI